MVVVAVVVVMVNNIYSNGSSGCFISRTIVVVVVVIVVVVVAAAVADDVDVDADVDVDVAQCSVARLNLLSVVEHEMILTVFLG